MADLVIRGRCVVLTNSVAARSIHVRDGVIDAVRDYDDVDGNSELIEADDDSIVMAGLVDTHVHVNAPGRTEWEGFETATRAAAAGGVTTIVDMPLNSIPATTTLDAFETKLAEARDKCFVDVGFWGGVVPGNTRELAPMLEAGVVGFKCFLAPSGVDEFQHVTEADLREAMPELARLDALLIVHAELPGLLVGGPPDGAESDYQTFLASRPRAAENEAIELMIRLSREFGTRVHIVHLSSSDAIPMLRDAQAEGVAISAETCPHYLHLAAEEIAAGATEFKCCPPIRERENRELLWQGLADGTIDMIVSDHSPCPGGMKLRDSGDFLAAWGGIASLQLRLPVVWTEARRRGFSLPDVAKWLCENPARQVRLESRKGLIAPGCDADLVIWNPDREFVVRGESLHHRHKLTPYQGESLYGVVQKTFLRGRKIYDGPQKGTEDTERSFRGKLICIPYLTTGTSSRFVI
ncbi:MAG TPA: allantoinase AllB [Pyrinomonadaceae bacterium]|nr:allantoinase AllB [Pyrinomonadaceae bacterium]